MAIFGSNRRFSQSRSAASVVNVVPERALSRFLLTTLIALATGIGLWSLRYLLPSQPQAIRFEDFTVLHIPLGQSYPNIAWLCWIPNAVVAQWLIKATASENSTPPVH
jgi:hypothetical protein